MSPIAPQKCMERDDNVGKILTATASVSIVEAVSWLQDTSTVILGK